MSLRYWSLCPKVAPVSLTDFFCSLQESFPTQQAVAKNIREQRFSFQEVLSVLQTFIRASPTRTGRSPSDSSLSGFFCWWRQSGRVEHFSRTKMADHRLCNLWIQLVCKHASPQVGACSQPASLRSYVFCVFWSQSFIFIPSNCHSLRAVSSIRD